MSFVATTEEELEKIAGYDTAEQEPIYEEEIITVNADGTVTITITVPPELCRALQVLYNNKTPHLFFLIISKLELILSINVEKD
ncbi:MAG: hypothetical protein ACOX08_11480 [Methanobacterium sp.]